MRKHYFCIFFLLCFTSPVFAQLSGNYLIDPGGGGDYPGLAEAASDLNAQGMSGNVTLQLAPAIYQEQVLFAIPNQSEDQMLTIESQTGNEEDVVFRYETAVEDTNYQLAFDEIKALTVRNISINTSELDYGVGIRFIGECSNITIDNIHHDGNRNDPGITAYYFIDFFNPPDPIHNLTVTNSYFHEASPSIGIGNNAVYQQPEGGWSNNLYFSGNTFFDADGITVFSSENITIENNIAYGEEYLVNPVNITACSGTISIEKNRFWKSSFEALKISNCVGTPENPIIVANNFISGKGTLVSLGVDTNLLFAFNAVYSDDDETLFSQILNVDTRIVNNILYQNHPEGNIFIYNPDAENDGIQDYNCLYSNGDYAFGFGDSGIETYDYEAYKAQTGAEEHGISVQPIFTIPGEDLHTGNQALNAGTPLSEITTDIDGELRSTVNPSIGADEIDGVEINNDLTIDTVITSGDMNAGDDLTVSWSGSNAGDLTLHSPWKDRIFLSDDPQLDNNDTEIGTYEVSDDLDVGATYSHQKIITLDVELAGTKYVIVKVDADVNLVEDGSNNTAVSAPFYISPPPLPNLVVTDITLPDQVFSGTQLQVQYTIKNEGDLPASGEWSDLVWQEGELDGFSDSREHHHLTTSPAANMNNPIGLMPGETYIGTAIIETPYLFNGYRHILIETDGYDDILEEPDANNNFSGALTDSVFVNQTPLADLVVEDIQVPAQSFAGEKINISYTIKNTGTQTTSPVELPYTFYFGFTWTPLFGDWVDYTYLSDTTFSFSWDQYKRVKGHYGNIEVDSSYVVNQQIQLPECEHGSYFITIYADRWNHVAELDEENNAAVSDTIQIIARPGPDLVPTSDDTGEGMAGNTSYTLHYHIENQGADTAHASWKDRVFLSDSATFQYDIDEMIADTARTEDLPEGTGVDLEIELNIPPSAYGQKYLYLWIDGANQVCEQPYDNNNILKIPVDIDQSPAADLQIAYYPPSNSYVAGDEVNLSPLVTNIGDASPNSDTWTDYIFFRDEETSNDSLFREEYPHSNGLDPNADYGLPDPFTIPLDIEPGFYSIGISADAQNEVWENESETNNSVLSDPFQVTIDSSRTPDLKPVSVQAENWTNGEYYSVEISITNAGPDIEIGTWIDQLILTDTLGEVLASATTNYSGSLHTDAEYVATFNLEIPTGAPAHAFFVVRTDTSNAIFEYREYNNTRKFPIQIQLGPTPDFAPTSLQTQTEVNAGQELRLSVNRKNIGETNVQSADWVERVLLSQDNMPDEDDILLQSYPYLSQNMVAGATDSFTDSIAIPLYYVGDYYVIYVMDADDQIGEGTAEVNNFVVSESPLQITTPLPVDFGSTLLDITIENGNPESIQYSIENTGDNTFNGKFSNTWYLSTDSAYSPDDLILGKDEVADYEHFGSYINLVSGASSTEYVPFIYQPVPEGDYYIIQKIDAFLNVYESNEENNNVIFGPFHINNIPEIFPDTTYSKQFGRNFIGFLMDDFGYSLGGQQLLYLPPSYNSGFDPSPDRHDYKINIPEGYGMITHIWENEEENEQYGINNESQPIYEMYVGEEYVPDPLNFDYIFDNPLQSDQTVMVPVGGDRTDYIKARAPYIPPHFDPDVVPVSNYFLRAEFRKFSVFSMTPAKVGTSHNVTLRIKGFDLSDTSGLDVSLFQETDTVYAFETYPQNPSELVAYIDMRGHAPGEYQLMVRKRSSGDFTIWDEPVEVIDDSGARIFTKVNAPASTRIGLDVPVSVTYGNDGYSNIYDMLVIVAIFMDDSTSTGLNVDYLGSSYPGYSGNGFISTEGNPAQPINLAVLDNAVFYGAYVPIVHARSSETFHFRISGDQRGIITVQASLGLVKRSLYTFSGRVADAGSSRYAVMLGNAIASSEDALAELAKLNNCDQTLDADQMTMRLAEQTYEVAKKAHGATSWWQDLKDNVTGLFGTNSNVKKRYDSYKGLIDQKGELDLTANEDTPFYSELTDVFDCIDPNDKTVEDTDDECVKIVTFTKGNRTFKVKSDMHGYLLSCPDPDDPEKKPEPKDKEEIDNTQSNDPNEIVGPRGSGPARIVDGNEPFEYTVYFENVADASAPAARVRIDNPLDSNLLLQSLRIVSFGFADTSFQFNNSPFIQRTINLGSKYQNQHLRIIGGTDPNSRQAFFEFTTINPATQGTVTGANQGFLLPNDSTGRGQGFVTYLIDPKADLDPGTEIKNKASIIFDGNEIIETNTWKNTIRGGNLASKVLELPEYSSSTFNLEWKNETGKYAPPVKSFDIYVRDIDGKDFWAKWLGDTKSLTKRFTGIPGHTYEFYSRARSENEFEFVNGSADARTTIINFKGDIDDGKPVLFPNPASDQSQLAFRSSGKDIPMKVRMTDIQGKLLYKHDFTTTGGGIQFLQLPVRKLSAGVYVVQLYEKDASRGTAKLVITGYPKP